ncbi:MAG: ABC transporter substrate-binding protein [Chloroflexota bacterium]
MGTRTKRTVTRRDFLKVGMLTGTVALLQACAPTAAPTPTTAPPTQTKPAAAANPTAAPVAAQPTATAAPATPTTAAGPKKGGTLTLACTMGIQEFNPMSLLVGHAPYIRSMYNTLVRYDSSLNPQPELAEKWDFSADGTVMTLKLREDVKFHTGRPFTSADVKTSVEFGQTNERSIMKTLFQTVKEVDTSEKYTVKLKFASVNPSVYDMLDVLYIVDQETLEDRSKNGVGTGPFKLDKYVPNDRVEMVAFKDYWDKGKPYLDRYIVRQIPDLAALAVNLESGAIDIAFNASLQDGARLRDEGGKYVVDPGAPGSTIFDVGINVKVEPFTDKRVRQAVAWSIDRERFCKTAMKGFSKPSCLIWPANSWAYFPDLQGKIGYDLDKARALLKEAGLENGFETELRTSSKTTIGYGDLAVILQADLKKIGINAKVDDLEPAQYTALNQKGDLVMMAHAYGRASRDPGSTLMGAKAWYLESEGGWNHYYSPEYEKLRNDLQSTLDQEKRKGLCRQIQELMLDECFTIPVGDGVRLWAYPTYVKGIEYNMDNALYAGGVWLDK